MTRSPFDERPLKWFAIISIVVGIACTVTFSVMAAKQHRGKSQAVSNQSECKFSEPVVNWLNVSQGLLRPSCPLNGTLKECSTDADCFIGVPDNCLFGGASDLRCVVASAGKRACGLIYQSLPTFSNDAGECPSDTQCALCAAETCGRPVAMCKPASHCHAPGITCYAEHVVPKTILDFPGLK